MPSHLPREILRGQGSLFTDVSQAPRTLPGKQYVFTKYVLNARMNSGSSEVINATVYPSASLPFFCGLKHVFQIFLKIK